MASLTFLSCVAPRSLRGPSAPCVGRTALCAKPVRACQPKRRARVRMCEDSFPDRSEPDANPVTVGDALRSWSRARDAGKTPAEGNGTGKKSMGVLFVDRENIGVGVIMEAIFTDLVRRRAPKLHIYCHSAGTRADGFRAPDPLVVEAMKFKRGIDVASHVSSLVSLSDLQSYDLVVCSDEATRSAVLFMTSDGKGTIDEAIEAKFVVISSYCSQERLRAMQFKDGKYSRDKLNFTVSAIIDACTGLLSSLLEAPSS